jgi:hypothetical protein
VAAPFVRPGGRRPICRLTHSDALRLVDAHLWSYAELYGLPGIFTELLQPDRMYGTIRVVNPFSGSS